MTSIQHCVQTPAIVIKGGGGMREIKKRQIELEIKMATLPFFFFCNITFYPQITSMFVSIEITKGWRLPEWWQEKFDRPCPREASIQLMKIINTKYLKGNTHMKKYLFKKIK